MRLLITGGAGFIGSAVIRQLIAETTASVVNVDKLTNAGSLRSLAAVADDPRHHFVRADIGDFAAMKRGFADHRPDAVMHLAAESHVDRSIDGPKAFVESNIVGTYTLLEAARWYWLGLDADAKARFRFHHVSTDEVFGSLGPTGACDETTPYRPRSPYSASKAAADHLARAWHHTYGLPAIVSNCANNYGPYQYPEKLIPVLIANALAGRPLPIYGAGDNVRDWLYVEDHAAALRLVLAEGRVGETYNIGARCESTNLEMARAVCAILDALRPDSPYRPHADLIAFVADRPGHDARYAIDPSKIEAELGWKPRETLETGLLKTVSWYVDNPDWLGGAERVERLGLAGAEPGR